MLIRSLAAALLAAVFSQASFARTDTLVAVSDGVKLRIVDTQTRDVPAVVLVPGWSFTADIFKKQLAALGERYRLIAFDPRSQGRSTLLDHANSPDERGEDIANLIATLKLDKPIVVGWSQGVQDVAAYVLEHGTSDVAGLVLVDAPVSGGAPAMKPEQAAATLGRMPIYVGAQRRYLEGMMSYVFRKPLSPAELDAIVSAAMQTPTSVGVSNLILDLFGKDYREAFPRIEVPTLVIAAGTSPEKDAQLAQRIANMTTKVVEGAGHAVFYDDPQAFDAALTAFIDEHAKARR